MTVCPWVEDILCMPGNLLSQFFENVIIRLEKLVGVKTEREREARHRPDPQDVSADPGLGRIAGSGAIALHVALARTCHAATRVSGCTSNPRQSQASRGVRSCPKRPKHRRSVTFGQLVSATAHCRYPSLTRSTGNAMISGTS